MAMGVNIGKEGEAKLTSAKATLREQTTHTQNLRWLLLVSVRRVVKTNDIGTSVHLDKRCSVHHNTHVMWLVAKVGIKSGPA